LNNSHGLTLASTPRLNLRQNMKVMQQLIGTFNKEANFMVTVTGVKFKTAGKIYDFNSNALAVNLEDRVIVETEQGLGFGIVAVPPREKAKMKSP
jgi:hypothetical protein